jgi:sphingolipid delta-4 desaturase
VETAAPSASVLPANVKDGGYTQFFWTYTEEPHRSRRQAIIKKHPEVTKLCGPEPLTKWLVLAVVSLQIICAHALRDTHPFSWQFLATAYIIGATANQNLFLAIHEISHNLAFKNGAANRILAVFANLPIAIPYSASFRVCTVQMPTKFAGLTFFHSLIISLIINPLESMVLTLIFLLPMKPSS